MPPRGSACDDAERDGGQLVATVDGERRKRLAKLVVHPLLLSAAGASAQALANMPPISLDRRTYSSTLE
jgi:hypothetical protein